MNSLSGCFKGADVLVDEIEVKRVRDPSDVPSLKKISERFSVGNCRIKQSTNAWFFVANHGNYNARNSEEDIATEHEAKRPRRRHNASKPMFCSSFF